MTISKKKKLIYVCPVCLSSESYRVDIDKPPLRTVRIFDGRCEKNSTRVCVGEHRETIYEESHQ